MRWARRTSSSTSTASATRCSASARTLRTLSVGQEVSLAIETHVREDAIRLFGFTSEVERAWFRTLQTIQGVGAKVALAVLGTLSPQDLGNAIALQNWAAVEQSPGVGKKLAQRIVAELKDKAPALSVAGLNVPVVGPQGGAGGGRQQRRRRGHLGADQPRLPARAGKPGRGGRDRRAGRCRRHAQADPPRAQGAGAVALHPSSRTRGTRDPGPCQRSLPQGPGQPPPRRRLPG